MTRPQPALGHFVGNKIRPWAIPSNGAFLPPPRGIKAEKVNQISTNGVKAMKKQWFTSIGAAVILLATGAQAATAAGSSTTIQAYYDHQLFNIQFVEFSPAAEKSLLQHNASLNFIYQSDAGLPGGQPFISVIDAIPGDGFNPIWEEVQVNFTPGHTPRQLFSDDEVEAALNAGEITLTFTGEVYWCPVVGK